MRPRLEPVLLVLLAGCAGAPDRGEGLRIETIRCYEVAGERPAVVAPNAYAAARPRAVREFVTVLTTNRPGLVGIGTGSPTRARLESGLIDIVQPDLNNLGILGVRRWAEAAHRHGAKLIAHNSGTKMGVYGSVHAVPNTDLVEADDSAFPSIEAPGLEWKGGRYRLTGVPGLGVRIASDALAKAKLHWTVP